MNASIIIPVRNGSATIADCLRALLNQKFSGSYEIIVVDDGSADNTAEIVKKFRSVKLIKQEPRGPAIARNTGAKNARYEIVVFTDADCIPEKDWLKEMLKPFANPKVAAVQGAYRTRQRSLIARFVQTEIEYRYNKMLRSKTIDWIGSYSAAYRKRIFLREQGFSEKFPKASGEDPELSYRLQKKGYKLVFNPKAIVYHRHPKSLMRYLRKKFQHAYWRILLYRMHKEKMVSDSYTPQALKAQIGMLALAILFAILSPFNSLFIQAFFAVLLLVLLFMLPFTFFALKRDFLIGLITPAVLFLRDAAFLFGLASGFISLYIRSSQAL
ncbi:MAG: glycosyltransferase [Candidatus Diapherotrites archaeon]|nr:glycosyltransferase [Candidatus Diapherotrites archaeon]